MKRRGSLIGCIAVAGLLLSGGVATPASAEERPCAADARTFCAHVERGDRQARARCLKEHLDELSPACKERLTTAHGAGTHPAVRDACAEDLRTLCSGIEPGGGRLRQCLQEHRDQLSAACQAALARARSNR